MCKSEIFETVLAAVAKETEIPIEKIVGGGKTREEVDARYLVVYYLKYAGFYESDIARMLRITRQAVGAILRQFETRRKQSGKIFEIIFLRIRNALEMD
jgi:hypothetical protein